MDFSPTVREIFRSVNNPRYLPSGTARFAGNLGFLPTLYDSFGARAVLAVKDGLSRRIKPTPKNVEELIDEWERRDTRCCYNGSVEELCGLQDTWVFAVSYRHAPRREWGRKDKDEEEKSNTERTCKLSDKDQELLKNVVSKLPGHSFVMLWCDQVLSTRLKNNKDSLPWCFRGLLPYATFIVLQLSTEQSKETLEKRIWIRVERSLGRMCYGFLDGNEASVFVRIHPGKLQAPADSMRNVANMILSGYWRPQKFEYWEDDFNVMRKWALFVSCRGEKYLVDLPLLARVEEVDNLEILKRMDKFAIILPGLESQEQVRTTRDKKFFLKATAWNPALKDQCWDDNPSYVCNDMGNFGDTRFSWWHAESRKYLFGVFADSPTNRSVKPTLVIATETDSCNGYQVYRCTGDLTHYRHAEPIAGPDTRELINAASDKQGFKYLTR